MSKQSSIAYQLRPNKVVDRELFMSLLGRLAAKLRLENYTYIGMGGPFMEDFRLVHAKIGIDKMFCIEREKPLSLRQKFNRPNEGVTCVNESIEKFLETNEFTIPVVVWLDYTEPKTVIVQLETFSQQLCELPMGSIVRITLNANPTSLGKLSGELLDVVLPGGSLECSPGVFSDGSKRLTDADTQGAEPPTVPEALQSKLKMGLPEENTHPVVAAAASEITPLVFPASEGSGQTATPAGEEPGSIAASAEENNKPVAKITELEWRLSRFKERLGGFCPNGITPDDMTHRNFGRSLLEALRLHAEREVLAHKERKLIWALATHYSDGQAMVTCTAVVVAIDDQEISQIVQQWPYFSTPQDPLRLDMPALTTLERLTMESNQNPKALMDYELPKSDMGEDPFEAFKRFRRVYPHFARVDL